MEIRPLLAADFAAILGWFPDEAALIQWGGPEVRFPLDAAQLERMLEEARRTPPGRALWAGVTEGNLIAHAQVALDWRHGVGRLSRVCVAPSARGKGLAVPFLEQIIRQAFEPPGFERLELNVYTFNRVAIKTYLRLGFVPEGVRRSCVSVAGARWNSAIFGLLRSEWSSKGRGALS